MISSHCNKKFYSFNAQATDNAGYIQRKHVIPLYEEPHHIENILAQCQHEYVMVVGSSFVGCSLSVLA